MAAPGCPGPAPEPNETPGFHRIPGQCRSANHVVVTTTWPGRHGCDNDVVQAGHPQDTPLPSAPAGTRSPPGRPGRREPAPHGRTRPADAPPTPTRHGLLARPPGTVKPGCPTSQDGEPWFTSPDPAAAPPAPLGPARGPSVAAVTATPPARLRPAGFGPAAA